MPNKALKDKAQKNYTSKTFQIYWQHARKYQWQVVVLAILTLAGMAAQLYMPFLYKNFFNTLGQNQRTDAILAILYSTIVGVLVLNLINWLAYRIIFFIVDSFEARTIRDIMNTCFAYLHDHSFGFFSGNFAGSLQRKVNRFSRSFEDIADLIIWDATPNILRVLVVIIVLVTQYWQVGLAVLAWSILHTTFNYYFTLYKLRYDLQRSEADTKISGYLADTITNIKLFTSLEREKESYRSLTQKWYTIAKKAWDLDAISYGIQGLLMVLMEFFVFYIGLRFWREGRFGIGDFVFMQSYIIMTFNNVWNFSRYLKRFYEAMSDANEMTEILEMLHEVQDVEGAPELHVTRGELQLKDIGYGYYSGTKIYEHFSLMVQGGEKVALIGPSGGGKSTFVKLLLRLYDVSSGQILIDGQDISKVTQESLRQNVSLVPQDPILFHRSIMENIRYAKPDATDAEVLEAARLAHCHEFISGFPDKYETFVGERGIKLSGGERQRVAIARAILKNAPILVLDEATSSLDSESERLIQDALKLIMGGKTVVGKNSIIGGNVWLTESVPPGSLVYHTSEVQLKPSRNGNG